MLALQAGCSNLTASTSTSASTGRDTTLARPAAPAAIELSPAALRPGIHTESVMVGGTKRTFAVVVPEHRDFRASRAPLFVHLHALDGHAGLDVVREWEMPAFEPLQAVFLVPQSAHGEWWQPDDAAFVLGLVEAAKAQWPIDRDCVVMMGYSNGGIGTWFFARMHPEHFSAAIPMASNETIIGPTTLSVYAIHGERDEVFPIDGVRRKISRLQTGGFPVKLSVLAGCEHVNARGCDYRQELGAARSWLQREVCAASAPSR